MIFELLVATILVTSLSLLGVFIFGERGRLVGTHRYIVPFAIGTFLGITFFELIPVALATNVLYGAVAIVSGFLGFYVLAHILHTYHHHHLHGADNDDRCEASPSSALLLMIGDAVHNFTDGVVVASAFLLNPVAGWVTTLGVALHEAPQEIAQFGVLRRAGFSVRKAALYNVVSASTIILGALLTLLVATLLGPYMWILTGVAAGNLLYVAMSDLIPGVQTTTRAHGYFYHSLIATVVGLVMIVTLIEWAHGSFGHHHHHDHGHGDHNHHHVPHSSEHSHDEAHHHGHDDSHEEHSHHDSDHTEQEYDAHRHNSEHSHHD